MRFRACFCTATMGLTLAASVLSAQTQQTGQTGSGTGKPGTTTPGSTGGAGGNTNIPGNTGNNPGNSTLNKGYPGNTNTNPNNQQLPSARQQIVTITGTVVLDDGTPPPMGVVIERECAGRKTREANVSPNGTFGFQLGGNNFSNLLPDASDNGSFFPWESSRTSPIGYPSGGLSPTTTMTGCELRAQLGGYRSSAIILTSNETIGVIDVGTIVLYPAARIRGTTVSVASLAAPKEAQRALGRADKAFQKKKLDDAERESLAALRVYPAFAAAWYRLGLVYVQTNRIAEAKDAYAKAMDADANYVNPYIELARLAAVEANWAETARLTDHALELDPIDFPYGYFMNAVANYNLGKYDPAEKSARRLNQLDPTHRWPQVYLLMASILHRKNDLGGEIAQLRAYLKYAPQSADAGEVRARLSSLEKNN